MLHIRSRPRKLAISGLNSTGKSTLLSAMNREGFRCCETQYARTVLHRLSWKVANIHENLINLDHFHSELVHEKFSMEYHRPCVAAERTFIDFFIFYAMYYEQHFLKEPFDLSKPFETSHVPLQKFYCQAILFHDLFYHHWIVLTRSPCLENDGIRNMDSTWLNRQLDYYQYFERIMPQLRLVEETDLAARLSIVKNIILFC